MYSIIPDCTLDTLYYEHLAFILWYFEHWLQWSCQHKGIFYSIFRYNKQGSYRTAIKHTETI